MAHHPPDKPREGEEHKPQPRLSVRFNLEKEPLRSEHPPTTLDQRENVALGPDQWTVRRRMAGWLYVLFAVLLLAMGTVAVWFVVRLIGAYYADL